MNLKRIYYLKTINNKMNDEYNIIQKMILDGVLTKTPPVHEETPEEKELSKYLKIIRVKSVMLISEKSFIPVLSIKFEDGTEETYSLPRDVIENLKNSKIFDWKSLLDISEKVKNNK